MSSCEILQSLDVENVACSRLLIGLQDMLN